MKKYLLYLAMCVFVLVSVDTALADEWHATNQVTVRWDAVTTLLDGTPVPAGDLVTYDVYTRSVQTGVEVQVVPAITTLETPISFSNEGDYHIGIRAVRTVPAAGEIPARNFYSTIGWSDDPLIVKDGLTFGVSFYIPMGSVTGFELSPPPI